jgi:hypothetical protein
MGCNCKKKGGEIQVTNVTIVPVIEETPTGMTYDWYNNIDEIRPYTKEDYLNDELRKWNGGDYPLIED